MKTACVIGWPITYSRSPLIHNFWLKQLSIEGHYERRPIESVDFERFLQNLRGEGYVGCNVTIPYKERAFAAIEKTDAIATKLQAVNTVYVREDGLHGTNSDVEGYRQSLAVELDPKELINEHAVLLGSGGAALAVAAALMELQIGHISIVSRNPEKTARAYERLGGCLSFHAWPVNSSLLEGCKIIVNATPLGMTGHQDLDIDLSDLPADAVVSDIVYSPLKTGLLRSAEAHGLRTVGGLGMLLHQAVRGFELWFGKRPMVTRELYDLVARDLDPNYRP